MPTTTCTIRTATSGICGEPAVTTFIGTDGTKYAECVAHNHTVTVLPEVDGDGRSDNLRAFIKTRSTAAYALVANFRIVGYAYSASPAVCQRAARLRARLLPIDHKAGKVIL